MNIGKWADCSSDEDTDDNYSVESEENDEDQSLDAGFSEKVQVDDPEGKAEPPARTYDFPEFPPFTAFVGNLSWDINETSQLQQALADVVFDRLGERIHVIGGRICYDRDSKNRQHRGFGYVELETLEELKVLMKLNDDAEAMMAGRKVQVDTANNHNRPNNNYNRRGGRGSYYQNNQNNQRGSFARRNSDRPQNNEPTEKVDGTKFRGGKYNNNNNSFRKNSFRNNNNNNNNSFQNDASSGDAPRQRLSLKLAPRSKPIDGGDRSSSSNIFGGAKARDEQAWEKNRQLQQEQQASASDEKKKKDGEDNKVSGKDNKMEHQERRQSGRGAGRGAGRGGKGRGNQHRGGTGRGDTNNQNQRRGSTRRQSHQQYDKKQDKRQQQPSPEEKAAAAAAAADKANNKQDSAPSNPQPKPPKNSFALLMDSDSD